MAKAAKFLSESTQPSHTVTFNSQHRPNIATNIICQSLITGLLFKKKTNNGFREQGMMPAFSASGCKLVDKLKELVSPGGSCEVDMAAEFQIFSADVIARAAFGSSYEQGKKVFELQKEQVVLVMEAYQSIYFPGLR